MPGLRRGSVPGGQPGRPWFLSAAQIQKGSARLELESFKVAEGPLQVSGSVYRATFNSQEATKTLIPQTATSFEKKFKWG